MGWLRAFGSRNHPKTRERKRALQKAREGMAVTPETVATYTAARGFILGEWFGASLACASVVLLNLLQPRCLVKGCSAAETVGPPAEVALGVSLAVAALGGFAFWRSHTYYRRLDFPWAKRWDTAAIVVAGSAAIFWLLFLLLWVLTLLGVRILPEDPAPGLP